MLSTSPYSILATLGPRSMTGSIISQMDEAGVSLFRINLSHTDVKDLKSTIETIRVHSQVPICIDSEGAQIRTRYLIGGKLELVEGTQIRLNFDEHPGDQNNLTLHPKNIASQFLLGDLIDIDFHGACLRVEEVGADSLSARIEQGGIIGENKAVSVNRTINLPFATEKDFEAIAIGREMGIEHFALSFANRVEDVEQFRDLIGEKAYLISKIESILGLKNLTAIADQTDAILIDRGDLSREVDLEKIPFVQRRIIASVRSRNKPVFVATNLLESMIEWHAPTRAEVNDVVSTLEMGANGLVLAAETAIGNHPLQAVKTIRQLIDHFESWTPNSTIDELLGINNTR